VTNGIRKGTAARPGEPAADGEEEQVGKSATDGDHPPGRTPSSPFCPQALGEQAFHVFAVRLANRGRTGVQQRPVERLEQPHQVVRGRLISRFARAASTNSARRSASAAQARRPAAVIL